MDMSLTRAFYKHSPMYPIWVHRTVIFIKQGRLKDTHTSLNPLFMGVIRTNIRGDATLKKGILFFNPREYKLRLFQQ